MATVDVSFSALPAHVRTARLISLAVARRVGVPEEMLDEVRLAVGEACSRAVGVHCANAPEAPISMRLSDDGGRFTVEVSDIGTLDDDPQAAAFGSFDVVAETTKWDDESSEAVPAGFGLVVIGGLVDEVEIIGDDSGTHVRMVWPSAAPTS